VVIDDGLFQGYDLDCVESYWSVPSSWARRPRLLVFRSSLLVGGSATHARRARLLNLRRPVPSSESTGLPAIWMPRLGPLGELDPMPIAWAAPAREINPIGPLSRGRSPDTPRGASSEPLAAVCGWRGMWVG